MNIKTLFPVIFLSLLFSSCIKEKFSQEELSKQIIDEGSIAVPIGFKTTTFADIFTENINDGELVEDEQGLYWFRFDQEFLNISAQDFIQYPEFTDSYAITNNTGAPIDLNAPGANVVINETFYLDFGFSGGANSEEIDSIILNNMDLDITVQLAVAANASLNVTFPGITYNGIPYSKNLVLSSTNNFSDMMEYTVALDNSTPNKNRLRIDFELTLNTSSGIIIPAGQTIVNADVRFFNIDFRAVYGYIGQHTFNSAVENILIDINNSNLSGYFNFDHVYFNLASENSFGVPFSFDLRDYMYRTYDAQNQLINESPLFANQSDVIAFPNLNQVGETINDTATIDLNPIQLYFQDFYSIISGSVDANANPNGKTDYNFVLDDSQLRLSAEFAAPFWGNTDNLIIQDTIDFNISEFFADDFDQISRLLFILNFTNANPLNTNAQVYFCDAGGNKLDSLFNSTLPVITGASDADANGKVGANINDPVKVEFLGERIDNLRNTNYVIVKTDFKTIGSEQSPPTSWKIFSDYYFYFHLGVAATLELSN
jgi:hypothetical protein